jgi:tetrapyrrole methylase family protein / MazG family protein
MSTSPIIGKSAPTPQADKLSPELGLQFLYLIFHLSLCLRAALAPFGGKVQETSHFLLESAPVLNYPLYMESKRKNRPGRPATVGQDRQQSFQELKSIMARLRSPSGCPWDRVQSEDTLKKYLLEEAYEAVEAIEAGTPDELREELGDLLLQILFLSQIAEEKRQFDFFDVARTLAEKLIRRHPHVFPGEHIDPPQPEDPQGVVKIWGAVKEMEGKYAGRKSVLDGIPLALPALERARRISERASRTGFDWPNIEAVWRKVREELGELKGALKAPPSTAVEEEFGDLLFALVNWGRFKGISGEESLRKATRRFMRRFGYLESALKREGRTPKEAPAAELDRLWEEAKSKTIRRRPRRAGQGKNREKKIKKSAGEAGTNP